MQIHQGVEPGSYQEPHLNRRLEIPNNRRDRCWEKVNHKWDCKVFLMISWKSRDSFPSLKECKTPYKCIKCSKPVCLNAARKFERSVSLSMCRKEKTSFWTYILLFIYIQFIIYMLCFQFFIILYLVKQVITFKNIYCVPTINI